LFRGYHSPPPKRCPRPPSTSAATELGVPIDTLLWLACRAPWVFSVFCEHKSATASTPALPDKRAGCQDFALPRAKPVWVVPGLCGSMARSRSTVHRAGGHHFRKTLETLKLGRAVIIYPDVTIRTPPISWDELSRGYLLLARSTPRDRQNPPVNPAARRSALTRAGHRVRRVEPRARGQSASAREDREGGRRRKPIQNMNSRWSVFSRDTVGFPEGKPSRFATRIQMDLIHAPVSLSAQNSAAIVRPVPCSHRKPLGPWEY
jgi:hypothetical protein